MERTGIDSERLVVADTTTLVAWCFNFLPSKKNRSLSLIPPTSSRWCLRASLIVSRLNFNTTQLKRLCENSAIPPTVVGGWFRSNLRTALTDFLNPTNGSWWMVQIRPSKQGGTEGIQKGLEFHGPSTCTGWIWNNPPTARWWDS